MDSLTMLLLFVSTVCLHFLQSAAQGLVPALYVFGDSTVDVGNNNYLETIVKANFPPYGRDFDTKRPTGRFSNGRLPTDYLASLLGLPFTPAYLDPKAKGNSIVQGVDFATSGSGFFDKTALNNNVPSLTDQLNWFRAYKQKLIGLVGKNNATSILSQALFSLSTGSEDYVNNYYLNVLLQEEYNRDAYRTLLINSFKNFVIGLYKLGARRIAIVSLSPLGCLPSQVTLYGKGQLKCIEFANADASSFNSVLNSTVQSLRESYTGLKLAYIDVYSVFSDTLKNPSQNGFQQTLTGCCGFGRLATSILCNEFTIGTCKDASKYVYWDSSHPSDAMNKIIANACLTQGASQLF